MGGNEVTGVFSRRKANGVSWKNKSSVTVRVWIFSGDAGGDNGISIFRTFDASLEGV